MEFPPLISEFLPLVHCYILDFNFFTCSRLAKDQLSHVPHRRPQGSHYIPRLQFTLLYFTAHALRLQISLPFSISHIRCCAAPAPFSAAFRIGFSIVLHTVSSTTADHLASFSSHFTATASAYMATSHANTSSTGTSLRDSHPRLPSTTSDAGT